MPENAQSGPASAILLEIPHLRAYARLMTNGRSELDRQVEDTLESVSADDIFGCDRSQLRIRLFQVLRGFLSRDPRSMVQRDIPHSYGNPCSPQAVAGDAVSDAQTVTEVGPAILRLDFEDREAIILSAAARFSDQEIAEICGSAPDTVRSRVHRGREQLAKILRVEFADELTDRTGSAATVDAADAPLTAAVL